MAHIFGKIFSLVKKIDCVNNFAAEICFHLFLFTNYAIAVSFFLIKMDPQSLIVNENY